MDKEILGQPTWLWVLGAVVVVGGYLYLRSRSSSKSGAAQPSGKPGGGGQYRSTSSFTETIRDLHSHPRKVGWG